MLSHSRLTEVLFYDRQNGQFLWVQPSSNRVKVGQVAGGKNLRGYVHVNLDGRRYAAHRLAWFFCYEKWPVNVIDHIDGDPSNNRIENLRDVTQQQNTRNLKLSKNNNSGFNGVSWSAAHKKWTAHIMINGRSIYLGAYPSAEAAADARARRDQVLGFNVRSPA